MPFLTAKTNAVLSLLLLLTVGGCRSSPSVEDKQGFLASRISVYVSHFDTLPESLDQLNDVFPEEERAGWDETIEQMTVDPWGNAITYALIDQGNRYELRSAGADGTLNTSDDVVLVGPESMPEVPEKVEIDADIERGMQADALERVQKIPVEELPVDDEFR